MVYFLYTSIQHPPTSRSGCSNFQATHETPLRGSTQPRIGVTPVTIINHDATDGPAFSTQTPLSLEQFPTPAAHEGSLPLRRFRGHKLLWVIRIRGVGLEAENPTHGRGADCSPHASAPVHQSTASVSVCVTRRSTPGTNKFGGTVFRSYTNEIAGQGYAISPEQPVSFYLFEIPTSILGPKPLLRSVCTETA